MFNESVLPAEGWRKIFDELSSDTADVPLRILFEMYPEVTLYGPAGGGALPAKIDSFVELVTVLNEVKLTDANKFTPKWARSKFNVFPVREDDIAQAVDEIGSYLYLHQLIMLTEHPLSSVRWMLSDAAPHNFDLEREVFRVPKLLVDYHILVSSGLFDRETLSKRTLDTVSSLMEQDFTKLSARMRGYSKLSADDRVAFFKRPKFSSWVWLKNKLDNMLYH